VKMMGPFAASAAVKYGDKLKILVYIMLVTSYFGGLARADLTGVSCVIGLISLHFRHKEAAAVFFGLVVLTFALDIVWITIHGQYLQQYGRIPKTASASITHLVRLHKMSLGMSIMQIFLKFTTSFFAYKYWYYLLPNDHLKVVGGNPEMEKLEYYNDYAHEADENFEPRLANARKSGDNKVDPNVSAGTGAGVEMKASPAVQGKRVAARTPAPATAQEETL